MHELCKQISVVLNKFVMNTHQDSVLNALFFIITIARVYFMKVLENLWMKMKIMNGSIGEI
jgi:hypothetical protein